MPTTPKRWTDTISEARDTTVCIEDDDDPRGGMLVITYAILACVVALTTGLVAMVSWGMGL